MAILVLERKDEDEMDLRMRLFDLEHDFRSLCIESTSAARTEVQKAFRYSLQNLVFQPFTHNLKVRSRDITMSGETARLHPE